MLIIAVLSFSLVGCEADEETSVEPEMADADEMENGAEATTEDDDFEAIKPQLEEHLKEEKEQELIAEHLKELEEEYNVEKYPEALSDGADETIVARVNDEEINFEQYQLREEQQMQMMIQQGMNPESPEMEQMMEELRPQILDDLVNNLVLEYKVAEENITVNDEELDEHYQMIAEQSGGEEMLKQQLEEEGFTIEELKEDITQQLKIQTYLSNFVEENLDEEQLEFSDEELRELYEEAMQQQQQMEVNIEDNN